MILEIENLDTYYGTSHILFQVNMNVDKGEVVCLLGRNGAGKTTTMRSIIGLTPPRSGSIKLFGEELIGTPTYRIAQKGIGYVPDNRQIFPDLTVKENLEIGHKLGRNGENNWTVERIYDIFPALRELKNNLGGYLSGGEQQMLTIGRTLMGNPEVLLLDEPVEGLAPLIVRMLGNQILELKKTGLPIIFSEQNILFATHVSSRAYVISKGKIHYQGTMEELQTNEEVKQQYLMV